MQNDDGYLVISGERPPDDLLAAVEAEISSSFPRRCGLNGQQLMKFNAKVCSYGRVPELIPVFS